jgi:Glycoside hydrolase 123, catalytic domain
MKRIAQCLSCCACAIALACAARAATPVLGPGSPVRTYTVWRTPAVKGKDGKIAPATRCSTWRSIAIETPPVSTGWQQSDFDDRYWLRGGVPRASAPGDSPDRFMRHDYGQSRSYVLAPAKAVLYLRARFKTSAAGKVKLSITYRGGAIIYLNGKEVARAHLPQGELTPATLASEYPLAAFETTSGKAIKYHHTSPKKYAANLTKRLRRLEQQIDARAGLNVLAVAVHRAPYRGNQIAKLRRGNMGYLWGPCGLVELKLEGNAAPAPRAAGPQVVAGSVATRESVDFRVDRLEPVRPIEIAGARNGTFTGKAVVFSAAAFPGLRATVSELKHSSGKGSIPAGQITILYGRNALLKGPPKKVEITRNRHGKAIGGAITGVWLKVRVPANAVPGRYRGTLAISAGGKKSLPVRLTVADYQLPAPRDWETVQGLVQSPESVAIQYKVPLWSDAHFKHMEQSFKLIGEAGGKKIVLYLVGRTCLGSEHTMVRWIKDPKAPGGYRHDFSVLERYLDMALKHVKPRVTVLYLWEKYMGGHGRFKYIDKSRASNLLPARVTLLDPASGKMSLMDGPLMDGKKFDLAGARAFWKPVCDGVLARLKQRGIEKTAVLGMVGDGKPSAEAVKTYKALMPAVLWTENGHMIRIGQSFSGVKIGYATAVYTGQPPPPGKTMKRNPMLTLFPRYGQFFMTRLSEWSRLGLHRHVTELTTRTGMNGIGRVGMDFWPFRRGKDRKVRDSSMTISGRFPESNQAQLNIHHAICHLLEPGPTGAVPSARYENVREGVQETQARLFIEKALAGGKISGDLAARARAVLAERTQYMRAGLIGSDWGWCEGMTPALAARLYETAGEVQKKSGAN